MKQLETDVLEAGRKVFGESYSLQLPSIDKLPSPPTKTAPANPLAATTRKPNVQSLAHEKQRLLRLEKLYAERIQKLKEAQKGASVSETLDRTEPNTLIQKTTSTTPIPTEQNSAVTKPTLPKPDSIITGDKIFFTKGADSDLEKEMVVVTPHRRRSLVDMSLTTKPKLKDSDSNAKDPHEVCLKDHNQVSAAAVNSATLVNNNIVIYSDPANLVKSTSDGVTLPDGQVDVELPGEQQLARLCNIQVSCLIRTL